MKITTTSTIFVFLAVIAGVITTPAFADHMTVEVTPVAGSVTSEDCASTPEGCLNPTEVTIDVGGTVTWINTDIQPHTATNGADLTSDDVGMIFDSSIMSKDQKYSKT